MTEIKITHLFSDLVVTEGQYSFEGRASPRQEVANSIIDLATGWAMYYRHLMKECKHKKVWKHSFSNELGGLI